MTVEVIPISGIPEVRPGDDLATLVVAGLAASGINPTDDDVVVVTQKVVSKAEGRLVAEAPEGKSAWVARESRRVVARRGDLVIAETRHGFVCANAGVDASNVGEGMVTLLPEDPDASAERLRRSIVSATGARVAVLVTDTFGRAWRRGVVNVAIGSAGFPVLVDLRGTKDATGRVLEATVVALADEVAAASGLVMGKAEGIPAAIVRGVDLTSAPPQPAVALVRPPEEDLFRESPLQLLRAQGPATLLGDAPVPIGAIVEAVRVAMAAHRSAPPNRLEILISPTPSTRLLEPFPGLGVAPPRVAVPWLRTTDGADPHEEAVLGSGATIERFLLALHALGLAWQWHPVPAAARPRIVERLGLEPGSLPLGAVAIGWPGSAGSERN